MTCDEHTDNNNGYPSQPYVAFTKRLLAATRSSEPIGQNTVVPQGPVDQTVHDTQNHGWDNEIHQQVDVVYVNL